MCPLPLPPGCGPNISDCSLPPALSLWRALGGGFALFSAACFQLVEIPFTSIKQDSPARQTPASHKHTLSFFFFREKEANSAYDPVPRNHSAQIDFDKLQLIVTCLHPDSQQPDLMISVGKYQAEGLSLPQMDTFNTQHCARPAYTAKPYARLSGHKSCEKLEYMCCCF